MASIQQADCRTILSLCWLCPPIQWNHLWAGRSCCYNISCVIQGYQQSNICFSVQEDRKVTMMMIASTSISESVTMSSTIGWLVTCGMIQLDSVTAGWGIKSLVSVRGKGMHITEQVLGTFHVHSKEIQHSLVAFGKTHAPVAWRSKMMLVKGRRRLH